MNPILLKQDFRWRVEDKMKTTTKIRRTCEKELTDIVGGLMDVDELKDDLKTLMAHRDPEYVIALMEKRKNSQKYHSTVYITQEDFKNYK